MKDDDDRRRQTTTDAREQTNTDSLTLCVGGPVIIDKRTHGGKKQIYTTTVTLLTSLTCQHIKRNQSTLFIYIILHYYFTLFYHTIETATLEEPKLSLIKFKSFGTKQRLEHYFYFAI